MADLSGMGLDPDVEASSGGGFTLVSPGKHQAVIMSDEIKPASNNPANKVMHVKWQIIKGQFRGVEIMDYWNILFTGPDPEKALKTQKAGQGKLRLACELTDAGYPPKDTRKMYGKPVFMINVVNDEYKSNKPDADGKFPMLKSNKVNSFSKAETTTPQTTTATPESEGNPWG